MGDSADIKLRIALAIDAGQQAAAATRQLAMGNSDPADRGTVFKRIYLGSARAVKGPRPTGHQVERSCALLDEFVATIADLNQKFTSTEVKIDTPYEWSGRLWDSPKAAPEVHNEVNEVLATLGRYRVALILGRPLRENNPSTKQGE